MEKRYVLTFALVILCSGSQIRSAPQKPVALPVSESAKNTKESEVRETRLMDEGMAAFKASNWIQAVTIFRQLVVSDPTSIEYVQALALTYQNAARFSEGSQLLKNKLPLFPNSDDQKTLKIALAENEFWWAKSLGDAFEYSKSIPHYQAAFAIDQTLRRENAARELNNLGAMYSALGQTQQSIQLYRRALIMRREVKDRNGEGITLNGLGIDYDTLGQTDQALDCYRQSLQIARDLKDTEGQSHTLTDIGLILSNTGQNEQAAKSLQEALKIARDSKNLEREGDALNALGGVSLSQSRVGEAIGFYNDALKVRLAAKDKPGEGDTLHNLGAAYREKNNYDQARFYYQKSLAISIATNDRRGQATTLNDLGGVFNELNQPALAIPLFERARVIFHEFGARRDEITTLNNIGEAYDALGQSDKALSYYTRALPLARLTQDRVLEAYILNNAGSAMSNLGLFDDTVQVLTRALVAEREIGARKAEGNTLANLAHTYSAHGDFDKASQLNGQALVILREVGDRAGEARTLNNLMTLGQKQKKPSLAIFYGKQSVNLYQSIRADMRSFDKASQKSFLDVNGETYRNLADILIAQGRLPEAEQVLQLLKQDEFFNFVRRDAKRATISEPTALTPEEADWVKRYNEIADRATQIGARLDELAKKHKSGRTTTEETEYQNLLKDQEAINGRFVVFLRELDASLSATRADKVQEIRDSQSWQAELARLQQKENINAAVIYTLVAADKYRVILLTANTRQQFEYSISQDELNQRVETLRRGLSNPALDPVPAAQSLYKAMFCDGQLETALQGAKIQTALWFLDGALRYVPIAALHDGTHYLVQNDRENVVITLASEKRGFDKPDAGGQMLGLGVSQPHQVEIKNDAGEMQKLDFEGLSAVPDELRGIIADKAQGGIGPIPGQILLDPAFTAQSLQEALGEGYKTVHIASHFNLQAGDENASFLLLGNGQPLALSQWQTQMNLQGVDLLTLSACETAVGNISKGSSGNGAEVDSLGEIVQQLGAASVVASLWPVSDSSTQLLMKEFYRIRAAHPELGKASALQQAQRELLQADVKSVTVGVGSRGMKLSQNGGASSVALMPFITNPQAPFAHPFYWAPFILIGNWR